MMPGGVGTYSGRLVMRTGEWERGLSSATVSLRTHGRKAKAIFRETRTEAEKYQIKVAELSAMHRKSLVDTETYRRKLAMLKREYQAMPAAIVKTNAAMAAGSKMMTAAAGMATGYLAPAVAAGAGMAASRRAEGIRRAMRGSQAIMGDLNEVTRGQMWRAAGTAAGETAFSTEETSKAFYYLASAGMSAEQSIAALPTVAKFAQAGMFDLSRATDLLTDSQMAMGMASKDAAQNMRSMGHVADVLVGANTLANASVEQFSEALTNKAAAALRMVNKDIEEGVAWLAVYANQGIKGADAGTALRIVLRDLQTKAIEHAAAFAKMKISVYDNQGAMRNLADIVGDFERALGGMSDQMKKATLLELGLSDKSVAYTQVLLGMSKEARRLEEQLRDMGGVMEDVAGKQLTDFAKGWERVKSVWDSMATGRIGKFMDSLGAVMQAATGNVTGVSDFAEKALAPQRSFLRGGLESTQGAAEYLASGMVTGFVGRGQDAPYHMTSRAQYEANRGARLDKAIAAAYQRNLDIGRRKEEARVRATVVRGKVVSAMRGTAETVAGHAMQLGTSLMQAGRMAAAEAGFQGRLWWMQQLGQGAGMRGNADALDKARAPFVTAAMRMLGVGTSGESLRFAPADAYGSQSAAATIARSLAPGMDQQRRTEEQILRELQKQERDRRELMAIAQRIAEKLVVPQVMNAPARQP